MKVFQQKVLSHQINHFHVKIISRIAMTGVLLLIKGKKIAYEYRDVCDIHVSAKKWCET